ncbi:MAG: M15 family metallopeptidase [Deltaproteobacteria bacterium]|nr:M15 family metallopeptidase [Deltaproteobacteria bacterium]
MTHLVFLVVIGLSSSVFSEEHPNRPSAYVENRAYTSSLSRLSDDDKLAMRGVTWHPGCPVPLEELRNLRFAHHDAKGKIQEGVLVVHSSVGPQWELIFGVLFSQGFVIEKAAPIRKYGGDDDKSMRNNNTSSFNCRKVTGGKGFSKHAYGVAIDVNPLWNPYVKRRGKNIKVEPEAGRVFIKRENRMGTIVADDDVVRIFRLFGFTWGGRWRSVKDYQHFEPLKKTRGESSKKSRQKTLAAWQNEKLHFKSLKLVRKKRRDAIRSGSGQ